MLKYSLHPIINEQSQTLIIGTLDGDHALRIGKYYSNPNDQFWRILNMVYEAPIPDDEEGRKAFLLERGLALWSVLYPVRGNGVIDSAVYDETANDFARMMDQFPGIVSIGFNGIQAGQWFRRHIERSKRVTISEHTRTQVLPLSAHIKGKYVLSLEDKVKHWRAFLWGKG